jgi:hypothetical protein
MDRKLGKLPKFLGFSFRNSPIFTFSLLLFTLFKIRYVAQVSEVIHLGLLKFSWLCFQMNMDDYPHFSLTEDGRLCSMGQHHPGFQ